MTNRSPLLQDGQTFTIAEVSERTGLSPDTLRYYEKAGLIEQVGRTSGNHRCYAAADLDWLAFLLRLRETGMRSPTCSTLRSYAVLGRRPSATG